MIIDVHFFKEAEVIDYSLLVGICELSGPQEGNNLMSLHDEKLS